MKQFWRGHREQVLISIVIMGAMLTALEFYGYFGVHIVTLVLWYLITAIGAFLWGWRRGRVHGVCYVLDLQKHARAMQNEAQTWQGLQDDDHDYRKGLH